MDVACIHHNLRMLQIRRAWVPRTVWPSLVTGLVWCAAALSAGYWVLQWPAGPGRTGTPQTPMGEVAEPSAAGLSRALGATPVAAASAPEAGRLQLLGVIAGSTGQGSALIATDGQPPKAYRVGQTVAEGLVLQSLSPQRAQLGARLNGPVQRELQLPALPGS